MILLMHVITYFFLPILFFFTKKSSADQKLTLREAMTEVMVKQVTSYLCSCCPRICLYNKTRGRKNITLDSTKANWINYSRK